ncbi:MAG: biosynthetic-type acetolactate synthase large subunit [Treponema sp.]|nr:biosynthetic-type acetolactate synthase large subunit [Treponema sp.]
MNYTGARIVIECLIAQGVDTVFGYPGGAVLNIYDELYKNEHRIKNVLTSDEQGACHAADGYARSTGKVGVVITTSGPGATNIVTALATAYMDSSPIVAITCNVPSNQLGKDSFQEVDITKITGTITKKNYCCCNVEELAQTIREAFFIAKSGRPGPVLIDIPKDVTAASCNYISHDARASTHSLPEVSRRLVQTGIPKEDKIADIAKKIAVSERPVIICGGGVISSEASASLYAFAEKISCPVVVTLMGKSAFPNSHELFAGLIGMHGSKSANMAVEESDLVIAIGTRFSDRITGDTSRFAKKSKVIHLDIDPSEINKNISAEDSLIGNIKYVLASLVPLVEKKECSEWLSKVRSWKEEVPEQKNAKNFLSPKFIYESARSILKHDAIVTTEVGQHQMWAAQFFSFEKPRTFITSGGLGTMGFGLGAAIGAQFANPEKQVVNFAGDGSFLMNCNELATIHHYNLPLVVVILNNGTLGMVRQWQTIFYEKNYSATTLNFTPDFVKLAESFGIRASRVEDEQDFERAFKDALESRKPYLIDCKVFIDEMVLPMIPPGKSVESLMMSLR